MGRGINVLAEVAWAANVISQIFLSLLCAVNIYAGFGLVQQNGATQATASAAQNPTTITLQVIMHLVHNIKYI